MVKKIVIKKSVKKSSAKKSAVKKTAAKKPVKIKEPKPIGIVSHFYSGLDVAIVKFKKNFKKGDAVRFKGHTTDFEQTIKSMQYDHKDIAVAKKGKEIGVKVSDKVREGDDVYEAK